MSENAARAIERLEIESATGCLTVHGPGGDEARLYLVDGQVSHAEAPAGEGSAALAQALGWWEATTTFDAQAPMSTKKTIGASARAVEVPQEWPEEVVPEAPEHFGFENDVRSLQAVLVLVGLVVVVVVAVIILGRKY